MKSFAAIIRLLTAGLFIFSGLVKVNDPQGTAIKMEEYFHVFTADIAGFFEIFIPFSLPIAVLMCISEVVLGTALLAGFRQKTVLGVLFGLIIFFTFLTFYSAFFDKVTDCGCFGDAIKLTPWQSFTKDIILLAMTGFLLFGFRNENRNEMPAIIATGFSLLVSAGIAFYALYYLPPQDFRAYKIGNSIPELMESPVPCKTVYLMEKDGEEVELENYPSDTSYKYVSARLVNEEECSPKITDYNVWNQESDFTKESFIGTKLIIVVHKLDGLDGSEFDEISRLAKQTGDIETLVFTAVDGKSFEDFRHQIQLSVPYYFADGKVLKTMIRSNPGLILMKNGTIKGKWSYRETPSASELKEAAGR